MKDNTDGNLIHLTIFSIHIPHKCIKISVIWEMNMNMGTQRVTGLGFHFTIVCTEHTQRTHEKYNSSQTSAKLI